jgi:hypothetical protein
VPNADIMPSFSLILDHLSLERRVAEQGEGRLIEYTLGFHHIPLNGKDEKFKLNPEFDVKKREIVACAD